MVMLGEGMLRYVLLDRRLTYLMCLFQGVFISRCVYFKVCLFQDVCCSNEVKFEVILSEGSWARVICEDRFISDANDVESNSVSSKYNHGHLLAIVNKHDI